MLELLREALEHWDDGYWWADRQLLLAVLAALLTGTIALAFKAAELALEARLAPTVADG